MDRRRAFAALSVALVVALAFVLLQGSGGQRRARGSAPPATGSPSATRQTEAAAGMPPAYLAWMPGGFPDGFAAKVPTLPGVERAVVVAGDTRWLTRSRTLNGDVVDDPTAPYAIPIDAFAVDPVTYAPFTPPAYRGLVVRALERGEAVLGATSARLRRLGPGGQLSFGAHTVTVGAVVPDPVVGWSEMLVSRTAGAPLGIVDDRYLLAQMSGHPSDAAFLALIQPYLTAGIPVRVDAPGEVRYVRVSSGSTPPVILKRVFGEFSAYPDPGDPIQIHVDAAWFDAHIETRDVPLLGSETCNRALFPALIGAMTQLQREGLGSLVMSNAGCYNPELLAAKDTAPPSFHAWGAAVDINAPQNPFGSAPHQDPRLVAVMRRWGFNWGGEFLVPDGMHFEYLNPPSPG
jgi:D-alanyl-D-alanine carboxypeptidase